MVFLPLSWAKEERLNLMFHTLSDRSRRQIIELLREAGELKVGDIAEAFSMSSLSSSGSP